MRQLVFKDFYTSYQIINLLWKMWAGLSKKIYFALYILSNGSSFWKKLHFGSKKKFQRKNNLYYSQSWKFSKVFWPKPNMRSIAHTKPLTLELLRSRVALCLLKIGEGIWSYQKIKSRSFKESGTSN